MGCFASKGGCVIKTYKDYVNKEWVGGSGTREIFNPATAEPFAIVPEAGKSDVDRAIHAAREAFDQADWRDSSLAMTRGRVLFKMAELVRKNSARRPAHNGAPLDETGGTPVLREFDGRDASNRNSRQARATTATGSGVC